MMGPPQEAKASAMAMSHSSKIRVPPVPPTTASSSPLLLLDELDHLVALASINSASSPPHSHAGQDRDEPKEHGHVEHASATTHDRSSRTPRDVLSQLNHLETRGPQSWLEVSGVLETLKPHQDLQSGKHAPSDSIDIHEVMKGLDDDDHDSYDNRKEGTGHIKMKHSTGRRHGTKPFDKSMIIHTLEELDGAGSFQQGKEKGVEVKKGVQDQNTRKGGSITKVEDRLSSIPKKGVGIPGSHGSVDLMGKVSMARKNNPSNGDFDVEYLGSYTNKASADHMISEPGNRVSTKISIRNVQADRPAQEEEEEEEKEVVLCVTHTNFHTYIHTYIYIFMMVWYVYIRPSIHPSALLVIVRSTTSTEESIVVIECERASPIMIVPPPIYCGLFFTTCTPDIYLNFVCK